MREMLEMLIKNYPSELINLKNEEGKTLLHFAAIENLVDIAELLIQKGADVNAKDYNESTPLHCAVWCSNIHMVSLLIENGADINTKDFYEKTPLHYAVESEHLDIVALLIENGADVNIQDDEGNTALHLAAEKGNLKIVKLLIEHGANPNIKDNYNHTPLKVAEIWEEKSEQWGCSEKFSRVSEYLENGSIEEEPDDDNYIVENALIDIKFHLNNEDFYNCIIYAYDKHNHKKLYEKVLMIEGDKIICEDPTKTILSKELQLKLLEKIYEKAYGNNIISKFIEEEKNIINKSIKETENVKINVSKRLSNDNDVDNR